jgi:hypothetical protein
MKHLGYPLTYATRCFIDGGCGITVYAHTNGTGDFVLFDKLGRPWLGHQFGGTLPRIGHGKVRARRAEPHREIELYQLDGAQFPISPSRTTEWGWVPITPDYRKIAFIQKLDTF